MGILTWIALGAIAGFVANMLVGGREGLIGTVLLGIAGAMIGGFLASVVFHAGDVTGFNLESLAIATAGAIAVVLVARALNGRRQPA